MRKEEQWDGAVGCEMWMCVCVYVLLAFRVKAGCSALILLFDPVESWRGTSSYIGS
jgi:hypothetical protein